MPPSTRPLTPEEVNDLIGPVTLPAGQVTTTEHAAFDHEETALRLRAAFLDFFAMLGLSRSAAERILSPDEPTA